MSVFKTKTGQKVVAFGFALLFALSLLFGGAQAVSEQAASTDSAIVYVLADGGGNNLPGGGG